MTKTAHLGCALAGFVTSVVLMGVSASAAFAAQAVQAVPATVADGTNWSVASSLPPAGPVTTFPYGTKPLVPVMGDWDGDGDRTPGTFESGVFKLTNSLPPGGPPLSVTFGDPRGFPVVGDFNGDGFDDLAVYRNGLWQLRMETGGAGSGGFLATPAPFTFGTGSWPTTIPVAGDWDGNGSDGVGVYTYATGQWTLREIPEGSDLPPFTYRITSGDYPVVGDWNGDRIDSVGVRSGTLWHLNNQNDSSPADVDVFSFGTANDLPLVGGGTTDVPPTAVADSATVSEDAAATAVPVLTNDTDPDGGPKAIASASDPANGTVVLTGGSAGAHTGLTYEPDPNYCNSPPATSLDTFTYTLAPGGSSATVSMTVTCVDDPPRAVNDAATVLEDSGANAVDVLANDTDVDGGPKNVASVVQPANGTVAVTGGGTGLTYTPNANYCNDAAGGAPDTFTYTLNGGSTATVMVTVTCAADSPVVDASAGALAYTENDPPTAVDPFVTVTDPDAGASITGATVAITTNFASGQDVLALSGVHPGISAMLMGNTLSLTGTATPAAYQAALRAVTYVNTSEAPSTLTRTVTFAVTDETARSGSDTRAIQVISVDDLPVAVSDSATVSEDAAAGAVPVLANDTDLDGGPKVIASASDPANGTVVLTGGSAGAHTGLTYQPDANYCNDPPGTAPDTFTYTLNGGSNATVSMKVTCVNDAPVADNDPFDDALGNTRFVVGTTSTGPRLTVAGDVLDGDTDVDTPAASLTAGPASITSAQCAGTCTGNVTMEPDGQFTYDPKPGFIGTDTFTYTVSDNDPDPPANQTATGTVSITVVGPLVWYVDGDASAAGDGRSHSPSKTLSALSTGGSLDGLDGTGDTIFVYDAASSYTGGLVLEAQQRLIGEPHSLDIDPDGPTGPQNDLVPAGGSNPVIVNSSGHGLTLSTANNIQGINLGNASGAALFGTGVSSATMNHLTAGTINNATGRAVDVSGGTLTMVFSSVSATGGQHGIRLDNTQGTFSAAGGTLSNATGTDVVISGNSSSDDIAFTYGGTISDDSGPLISISNQSGGLKDFNGSITDVPATPNNGGGISLSSNSASTTTRFDGGLTLSTGASNAIVGNSGGTLAITDPGGLGVGVDNTVASTTGTPLNLVNTTIHDDDLTFRSIASNGASSGIVLGNTVNPNGRLVVTGGGGACTSAATCTGGAIQSSTTSGVSLTNVSGGVSLTRMAISGSADDGVRGIDVHGTGFDLDNAWINANGNAPTTGGIHGDHGVDFTALTGTSTFTNTTVSNSADSNVVVEGAPGAMTLDVTGGTYSGAGGGMGDSIYVETNGTGAQNLNVQGPITFANNVGSHVQHNGNPTSTADSDVTVNNATMSSPVGGGAVLGGGITVVHGGPTTGGGSNVDATITNNNIQNSVIGAIVVGTTGSVSNQQIANVDATISNNTIGTAGVAGSGSVQGNGIFVDSNGNSNVRALITNNTIRQWTNRNGIALDVLDGDAAMSATVKGNILTEPNSAFAGTSTRGMTIQLGAAQAGDAVDVCLDIGDVANTALKNQVVGTGEGSQPDVRYLHEGPGSIVQLVGYSGPAAPSIADIANWFQPRNNLNGTPRVTGTATAPGGSTTTGAASCPQPAP